MKRYSDFPRGQSVEWKKNLLKFLIKKIYYEKTDRHTYENDEVIWVI